MVAVTTGDVFTFKLVVHTILLIGNSGFAIEISCGRHVIGIKNDDSIILIDQCSKKILG